MGKVYNYFGATGSQNSRSTMANRILIARNPSERFLSWQILFWGWGFFNVISFPTECLPWSLGCRLMKIPLLQ